LIQGRVEEGFWRVARALERQVRRSGGGAAVCVYHRGRPVVDAWAGERDDEGRPWQADTMAMSFSTSKGVLATLLHVLVDRGLLDYDDRVARHWPAFGQNGKAHITVRDVLCHRAGLSRLRPLLDRGDRILDWEYMVQGLERARPGPETGRRSAYHAFTFGWLAGELVQRVSGRPLGALLRQELAEPLGLDGLFIGAPPEARARAASLARPGPVPRIAGFLAAPALGAALDGAARLTRLLPVDPLLLRDALVPPGAAEVLFGPRILDVPVPAANGLFTARSLARMYAALAGAGTLDGVQLLSPETLRRATQVQTRAPDRVLVVPMHWRLGYHSAFTTRGRLASGFGHFGYGGSGAFADPRRELAVAMVNNRPAGGPFGDARIASLASAALASARAVGRRGAAAPSSSSRRHAQAAGPPGPAAG
jgi:CubicO group peptidase (beta-lactamase class C family)